MKNVTLALFLLWAGWIFPEQPRFPAKGPGGHWLSAREAYQKYGFGPKPKWDGSTFTPWGVPVTKGRGDWRPIQTPWGTQLQRFR